MTSLSFLSGRLRLGNHLSVWWNGSLPWLAGLLAGVLVLVAGHTHTQFSHDRELAESRRNLQQQLDEKASRLQVALDDNLMVGNGMVAFILANPELRDTDFTLIARNLMSHRTQIREIALARGTIITNVFPLQGNEAALGMDYREHSGQWPLVQQAIGLRQTTIAGPMHLVQGGEAFIARFPVFVPARPAALPAEAVPAGEDETRSYWGMVSLPIEVGPLLARAGLLTPRPWQLAIRGKDGQGQQGAVFLGSPQVFGQQPVEATITLPAGSWILAAIPENGWPGSQGQTTGRILTILLACTAAAAVTGLIFHLRRTRFCPSGLPLARGKPLPPRPQGPVERTAFLNAAEVELDVCRRYGRPLAVVIARINDIDMLQQRLGAEGLNTLLSRAGTSCRNALRPQDIMGVLSPGTFATVLVGVNEDGLSMSADRLSRAIRAIQPLTLALQVSTSLGTALLTAEDTSASEVIYRAIGNLPPPDEASLPVTL